MAADGLEDSYLYRMRVIAILVLALCFLGCGNNKDEEPPTIDVLAPLANARYAVDDLIEVKATVVDDKDIEYVSVTLVGTGLQPVHRTEEYQPGTTTYGLNVEYSLAGFDDPSAVYYLRIRAGDGENVTNEYVELFIDGTPLEREAIVLASEDGSTVLLQAVQTDQTVTGIGTIATDLSGLAVDPAEQLIVVAGAYVPEITGIAYGTGSTVWAESTFDDPPFPTFTSAAHFDGLTHVCYRNGFVRGLDFNGDVQLTCQMDADHFPLRSYLFEEQVLVVEQEYSTSALQLAAYWSFSGEIAQRIDLPFDEVLGCAVLNSNQVFVAGNENGTAKLMLYHVGDNDLFTIDAGPDEYVQCVAEIAPGVLLFGTADDLLWYDYAASSTLALNTGSGATVLATDALLNEFIAANGSEIRVFSSNTRALQYTANSTAPIDAMAILYNR